MGCGDGIGRHFVGGSRRCWPCRRCARECRDIWLWKCAFYRLSLEFRVVCSVFASSVGLGLQLTIRHSFLLYLPTCSLRMLIVLVRVTVRYQSCSERDGSSPPLYSPPSFMSDSHDRHDHSTTPPSKADGRAGRNSNLPTSNQTLTWSLYY